MRPKRIILIRHGESEGNADKKVFETIPDYQLSLTPGGEEQAKQAGQEIKNTSNLSTHSRKHKG